jgi:methylated-DNA-[protein]-cysteine S-methyltransferase
MNSYTTIKTEALGELLLVANETKLTGIYYADCKHVPKARAKWKHDAKHPVLKQAGAELQEFLSGRRTSFSVPLQFAGTKFQQKVWSQLAKIPFGETISYSELARRVGSPRAMRAAGSANGKNPFSIVIPCHRVISKDGTLGGYAGRLDRKQRLLDLERGGASIQF